MKNTVKLCIITLVLGMLLAFVIFTLFANRISHPGYGFAYV